MNVVLGPATVHRYGRGWRSRCEGCGQVADKPRATISAALEWQAWHAPLRGCTVPSHVPPRALPVPRYLTRQRPAGRPTVAA